MVNVQLPPPGLPRWKKASALHQRHVPDKLKSKRKHCVTAATVGLRFLPPCLHSVLRSRAASSYWTDELRARRKPRMLMRYDGTLKLRNAERQRPAERIQLPPRYTRYEPVVGPAGSVTVDAL